MYVEIHCDFDSYIFLFWTGVAQQLAVGLRTHRSRLREFRQEGIKQLGKHKGRGLQALARIKAGIDENNDEIKEFKKGAAILSLNVGAPIVPVALDGIHEIWPRAHRPRWSKLLPLSGARARICFGPPLQPSAGAQPGDEEYSSVTARLRGAIGEMLDALRGGPTG